ncbi:MAG: polysaccharide deacetylase family protein [Bacteroidota bacterium]|nr:polysaccharide deacetylase family protein [Bacteroidota bacterium]
MKNVLELTVQRISLFILLALPVTLYSGCDSDSQPAKPASPPAPKTVAAETPPVNGPMADAATILHRTEVPILCYHQIRDFKPTDSHTAKDYIVPVANFREQMKLLADSGYHSILPDQLYDYLAYGKALPSRPVMITFDDTRLDHYTIAIPEMKKYGYKGVFFIMTVSLGRPGYMSKEQVKQISDEGNIIGSHTWDHHNVKKYTGNDWMIQVEKPSKQLADITGKPVEYFAYPFGLWNKESIANLKRYKFKAVFQLSDRRDENDPLYSIRRVIIPGEWSAAGMLRVMKNSFR